MARFVVRTAALGLGLGFGLVVGACSSGAAEDCTPGKRGCECIAFECLGGDLECINGICQMPGDELGADTGTTESAGDEADSSSTGESSTDTDTDSSEADSGSESTGDSTDTDTGSTETDTGSTETDSGTTETDTGTTETGTDTTETGEEILGAADLVAGDLVVTEIMWDPSACGNDACEWFELYNAAGLAIDLEGLQVRDSLQSFGTLGPAPLLGPGEYVVLAKGDAQSWPYLEVPALFHNGSFSLNNGSDDKVVIFYGLTTIDESALYPANQGDPGVSWQLDPDSLDAVANDDPGSWCFSTLEFDLGELGSPALPNEACAP